MHHLYPLAKGDPLCPLGFHPQVRWPTRCKRCFRDYKEHGGGGGSGGRRRDDDFASTPSLATWTSPVGAARGRDEETSGEKTGRGWASSTNLSSIDTPKKDTLSTGGNKTSTWTSTPDLANDSDTTTAVTFSLKLPKRRNTGPLPSIDTGQNVTDTVLVRRPSPSPPPTAAATITINKNDSLAERVRKMQLIKSQNSFEKESSIEKEREKRSASRSKEEEKTVKLKEERASAKDDVNFLIQVKNSRNTSSNSKPPIRGGPARDKEDTSDDETSTAGTITTDTTLVDANIKDYQDQIENLKQEVDLLRKRCERVEKEKSDILLRRLANIDTANKYTTGRSSEVLKLQQKVNELTTQNEDLRDEKKHLALRVREIEAELESRPSIEAQTKQIEQLRSKLLAAETLCEELMDENEDMKKELRELEEEIEEMQDNFREDQADEYSSLRRELEQTIKNCRVLSFKLKKTERKAEQLEIEKAEQEKKLLEIVGGQDGMQRENRIKELEQEVARSTEVSLRLQRDLADANAKLAAVSGAPPANLKKHTPPSDGKVSRSSLTRGGSQEDPAQLLRDLQDSLEREADLREQLRNAEEEASRYRHRYAGRRIPHLPNSPQLAFTSKSQTNSVEDKSRQQIIETQIALDKKLSSFDLRKLTIGVNEIAQSPQDHIQYYSQGCQTDHVLLLDIGTEITKITLDSNVQCTISNSEMYTQTEIPFTKNKVAQTDILQRNCLTQTDKAKERVAATQTAPQMKNDISTQIENYIIESIDVSTNTKGLVVIDKSVSTESCAPNVSCSDDTDSMKNNNEILDRRKEKSDSPPLSSDKTVPGPSDRIFPFVSLFNPLAARIPIANNLRKTASRVEDDNESLLLQLKKMATKARSRKLSPTPPSNRLSIEAPNEKDEGISDEEDPAELRLLLELNEQESAVLRRKVEDLEQERDSLKKQVKELTEKISSISSKQNNTTTTGIRRTTGKSNNLAEEKVKVLEDEIAELRKKLIEKDRDCERLHAELSIAQKKPKASLIKSKSLDGGNDLQNVDLKRQLQVIEQEANVLRAKTQSLEADNEKLQSENKKLQLMKNAKSIKSDKNLEQSSIKVTQLETELKEALAKIRDLESSKEKDEKTEKKVRFGSDLNKKDAETLKLKQEELDKLKLNYTKMEKEKAKLQLTLKELKEDAIKSFKPRSPKKLTDLTTKLQMKKMVDDLENEIGELYVIMKNAGLSSQEINAKAQLEKDIEEIRSKLSRNESEFKNEKNRLQTEIGKLKDINSKLESEKVSFTDKCKGLEVENQKVLSECKTLKEEKKNLESQISKLSADLKKTSTYQTAMSDCMKKIEDLKKEMDTKDKEIDKLKKQVDSINKLEQDKNKLLKEVGDKTKKITELEKKLKETEEKCKRNEKLLSSQKDRVSKLQKELTEEKQQAEALINSHRRSSIEFTSEKDELQTKLIKSESKVINLETDIRDLKKEYDKKIIDLESTIAAKDTHIKQLEDALRETSHQKYDEPVLSSELSQMKEKYETATKEIQDKEEELLSAKQKLNTIEKELSILQTETTQLKSEIAKHENERKDLENKLQTEKKESKYWENKTSELESDLQAKLEHSLAMEKAEYEELTVKYELLEEEHVVTKARLTVEKEQAQGELLHVRKELNATLSDLKSLQEKMETQVSNLNKEKSELQNEISSLQERLCGGGWEVERARLQARLEQRERELRDAHDQRDVLAHHQDITKKELEEARKKLEDYEKVSKVHRNLSADNVELERELAAMNGRLEQAERARKAELADTKIRYEGQMTTMRDELKSLHNQVSRFRRERDNYKQMLEAAQKTMEELKSGEKRTHRASISSTDEEEYRNKVAVLEQQMACLEDELCEARLLSSKLNTELVSERSQAEVRLAEMQSRLNEYEEERLLSSGRARVAGLATRMELAWHKERDEQQRLLQETSTLARDLRQTLFEVERERDKERLDMKRRIEQLKRTTEEEIEEAKKKVTELQCDLLELRDAHAKLRTASEKLRRDKERHERDRDQNKLLVASLKRAQQEDDRVITQLLETIDDLMKQSPELFRNEQPVKPEKSLMTPTPPRRNRSSKSRSRSGTPESAEVASAASAAATAARLRRLTDELRASRIAERTRRHQAAGMRRGMTAEPRDAMSVSPATRTPSRASSLKKRSISLEQTTKEQSTIWMSVEEGSVSSMQSLDGEDSRLYTLPRDSSLDSRLSGGSAQSDVLPTEKKKKKSIFGKLKKLTKSRSVDDHVENAEVVDFRPIGTVSQGSDSDMSTAGSKRDLRGRISDMFSRKGQISRTSSSKEQSPERASSSASTGSARPILRNASTNALTRQSPAKPVTHPVLMLCF
ncbi:Coiled-coil domain-containing protein 165 [Papilio machaon]|uniref:Coiled-coil domain-containing protein 165 n=1 Tax=Papilio machaon TaxID=76193 RepID=A0A194RGU1_PAPMA|nr:Coiled-coil domain-containing protein 165 [Papilio machaon]